MTDRPAKEQNGRGSLVHYWLYGIMKAASQFGNQAVFLRVAQSAMFQRFFAASELRLPKEASVLEVCRAYTKSLIRNGIIEKGDVSFAQRDERIVGEIEESCPYRQTCTWVHGEGLPVYCFRATALTELLRITTKQEFDSRLESFGVPCRIALVPSHLEGSSDGD